MEKRKRRRSDRAGRPAMRSPGRPRVAGRVLPLCRDARPARVIDLLGVQQYVEPGAQILIQPARTIQPAPGFAHAAKRQGRTGPKVYWSEDMVILDVPGRTSI